MDYFTVKNFEKFQHYKDRSPPWIKLYNDLLDNYEFSRLQDASKLHLVLIWLLASRHDNRLPWDPKWIAARIGATEEVDLSSLEKAGFICKVVNGSDVLAECNRIACLETEGETEERESKSLSSVSGRNGITGQAEEVLKFLNDKTKRKFRGLDANGRPTPNLRFVMDRLKSGATVQDCKTVIARKFREWAGDDKMRQYLRPETLFNATKFEQYLGECTTEEMPRG